ncbi:type II toxin-antitoxin system toxin DNA ADP-ribosyl transferase DarT [Haliangium sp.]|uniref:type II toxin-antitoxin system toxin DNA ADP-ribosyl transferase DarT n=1 Tax=Haliangium sp. TaxID=2663208 RepID=UPI003D103887
MRSPRRIYHLTHIDNLPGISEAGGLWSHARSLARDRTRRDVGMSRIKRRRLTLPVPPHPGTHVGEYVPFYFCPRSIMLYVIHRADHQDLAYRGGQEPVIHLSAPLDDVLDWAEQHGRRWAFSHTNASTRHAHFSSRRDRLQRLDWRAIAQRDFRLPHVREAKQAELLVHDFFPLALVDEVGAMTEPVATRVQDALALSRHRPQVRIRRQWYH